jgi:hypothetical protein
MRRLPALAILAMLAAAPAAHADSDGDPAATSDDPPAPPATSDAPPVTPATSDAPPAPPATSDAPATPSAPAPAAPADEIVLLPRRPPSTLRRIAAISAAIFPGFIVRGAGSYVLGERRTAKRLLVAGSVGVAAMAAGGGAIGASGAASQLIWPGVPVTVLGLGIFMPTWLADIWVAAGGERVRAGPHGTPPWSLELSATGLRDPYRARALGGAAASVELGRLGLGASALLDAQGESRTADLEARWRILGAAAGHGPIDEGSRLYLRAAARYHRDDPDAVTLATAELEAVLRGELRHLDPLLAGMFLEVSTGLGLERVTYARDTHDVDSILLGRFAWGAYLGQRGEAMLFYDHRRDHLAGGLYTWRASGFVGSFGARAQVAITGPWAVRAELEVGNAWVGTLGLRYQGGAP